MEWVETTAKSVDAAKEAALDRLGVAADEAEFEVIEEPKPGLFGRTRGEGRVRARVRPAQVRPKQERRRRTSKGGSNSSSAGSSDESRDNASSTDTEPSPSETAADASDGTDSQISKESSGSRSRGTGRRNDRPAKTNSQETTMSNDDHDQPSVPPEEVGAAAVTFMDGLVSAFGATGSSELSVDGIELEVKVSGEELGLLVGPGGRTLNAVQDLVRVAAQRRLGDHETRLRIDVGGYRERRVEALQRFARDVAESVRESGAARALEPMTSSDRKVIHDALNEEDGVGSRSEGDDPNRRIVVVPD